MKQIFEKWAGFEPKEVRCLLDRMAGRSKTFWLRSEILSEFQAFCAQGDRDRLREGDVAKAMGTVQEAVLHRDGLYVACRPGIARWEYVRIHPESLECEEISAANFLAVKEELVLPPDARNRPTLEIDLRPFEKEFPKMERTRSIGRGVQFLNRHLAGRLFVRNGKGAELLFEFLRVHEHRGRPLMLNERVGDADALKAALREAIEHLEEQSPETPRSELEATLSEMGFEPGWGSTARGIGEMMNLLYDLFEAPDPAQLEDFLSRIPMLFNLAIISPHGYFGQSDVLGKPDTGGQVVYILDQVRALEKELRNSLREQGLDIEPRILVITRLIPEAEGTTCNEPVERILGTQSAEIIRIPFRTEDGDVVPHWISRFKVWPFLERFAAEAGQELLRILGGRPDFVVGNYSDGNLVASLLAHTMGITQCTIAHALEKTKYLYSDIYWKDHEEDHHFACQFTADFIAMSAADFIITSTYQEIAGTEQTLGQYESYTAFSLPGLYRVVSGVDPFDPKFNIVSPGADPEVFYPYSAESGVSAEVAEEVEDLIFGGERPEVLGELENPDKPLLFAMSRLDEIKNVSGLVDWYGRSANLRERANLLVVGGQFRVEDSTDEEEREQIRLMHTLVKSHKLAGQIRWVVMQADKIRVGEIYRRVARGGGVFVQPAKFEAFGLTVIEAMSSGLPVFATLYGGPLEIVEDGISGFHIDPNHGDAAAARMAGFLGRCAEDPDIWRRISEGAIQRVEERYTWRRYARRMLALCRIYGFWKYMTNIDHADTRMYITMFYHLMYKRLADRVPL